MAAAFSYAQAAKGLSSTQTTRPSSTEPNDAGSKSEEQIADSDAQVNQDPAASEKDAARGTEKVAAEPSSKEEEPALVTNAKKDIPGTSSSSVGNSSTAPKDEESSNTANGTSESTWDKQSQASGTEKPNGAATGEESEKSSEKEKNAPPPKELKAAPLPSVNVWQQRKEAQEAKTKVTGNLKPASPANKPAPSKTTVSSTSSTSGDVQQDQPKAALKKKAADGASENVKPRGKADGGKNREDGSVPPVADASLWPTPQVAQGEEKKKAQEKLEKADKVEKPAEKAPAGRSHGKEKWMPVPYVPNPVFSTPLPPAGGRRGGRAARGGRDAGRHATHGAGATAADKAASGHAGQGPAAKHAANDRGRNEPNTARANSLPAQSRRSNSTEASTAVADSRKGTDRTRGPKGPDDVNTSKQVNGNDAFPRHHRDNKSFARNQDSTVPQKGERNAPLTIDPQNRNGPAQDRRFENGPKSAEFSSFYENKDRDFPHHPNTRERGESRTERGGRGGSHRGRGGGHTGHGGSQVPYYANSHMQHQPFVHPKSYGYKSSHGFSNPRGVPMRSPSLSNPAAMYGVYPFPTDLNTMYAAAYQPMPSGPMTAMPYQPYMEPFTVMGMISMQLEYYFSVDNLCKDLFLRKHMDSQGFVMLSFIASFKRIKTLTEDFELLRHVSRQLRTVEYHVGEDGVDRLRPREKWEQWVFPMDQRDPSAQTDGPSQSQSHSKENVPPQTHNHVDGAVNGVSHSHSLPNGASSEPRLSKTPLSSTAPEFSPSKPLTPQSEISNVRFPST